MRGTHLGGSEVLRRHMNKTKPTNEHIRSLSNFNFLHHLIFWLKFADSFASPSVSSETLVLHAKPEATAIRFQEYITYSSRYCHNRRYEVKKFTNL